ncbi:hypothetical protein ACFX1Q_006773 [Malus domestica]
MMLSASPNHGRKFSLPVQAQKQEKEMHTPYAGINLFRFKGTISASPAPRILTTRPVLEQIQAPLKNKIMRIA